jgi:hypothetical protein
VSLRLWRAPQPYFKLRFCSLIAFGPDCFSFPVGDPEHARKRRRPRQRRLRSLPGTVPEGAFWPLRHAVAERRFFARLRLLGDVSSRREAVVLDRTRGRDGWRSADLMRLILREAIGVRPLNVARGYTGGSLYFNIYVR